MPWGPDDWDRLGEQLIARRVDLNAAWSNRKRFTADTGVDYRVVYDLERAKRTNFTPAMLRRLEIAYRLRAGAITAILNGDDLAPWAEGGTLAEPDVDITHVRLGEQDWLLVPVPHGLSPQERERVAQAAREALAEVLGGE